MQAGRLGTAGVAGGETADFRAGRHPVAGGDGWCQRLIGGAEATGVRHADNSAAGNPTGEDHDAGTGGSDHRRRWGGEVDPAVSRQPRRRRRVEAPRDAVGVHRPPELRRRGGGHEPELRRGGGGRSREQQQQNDEQGGEHARQGAGNSESVRDGLWTTAHCG